MSRSPRLNIRKPDFLSDSDMGSHFMHRDRYDSRSIGSAMVLPQEIRVAENYVKVLYRRQIALGGLANSHIRKSRMSVAASEGAL